MAYQRPTLEELRDRMRGGFRTEFAAAGRALEAFVRYTTTWVQTEVWGGALHLLYGLLEWGTKQVVPSTADRAYLLEHGKTYGMAPLPATAATGQLRFEGTNATVIPAGRRLVRADGVQVETSAIATISGGSVVVAAVAVTPGTAANMAAETPLSLVSDLAGVAAVFTDSSWTTGTNAETTEAFRDRLLYRTARTPQGGAGVDYGVWTRLYPGVTKVLVHPLGRGAGTVDVYFLHEDGPGDPIGVPDIGQVAAVQAILDARRPVVASVLARGPLSLPIDLDLRIFPDTEENRAAVIAEFQALFLLKALSGQTIHYSDYWAAATAALSPELESVEMLAPTTSTTVAIGVVAVQGWTTWE